MNIVLACAMCFGAQETSMIAGAIYRSFQSMSSAVTVSGGWNGRRTVPE